MVTGPPGTSTSRTPPVRRATCSSSTITTRRSSSSSSASRLSGLNPYTGQQQNDIMVALADQTEMKTLHMVTADPMRTPTFTPFADPDWFFFATGGATPTLCTAPPPAAPCITIPPRGPSSFAWNHGDIQDEIASTWAGYVGPGVRNLGDDNNIWTDHTDHRPTVMTLAGLKDD